MSTLAFVRKVSFRLLLVSLLLAIPKVALGDQPDGIAVQNQGESAEQGEGSLATLMETATDLLSGLDLQGCVGSAAGMTELLQ